jgi:hypothetical protein
VSENVAESRAESVSGPVRVSPWVTHERLDDEVIAINLETGAYYALDDVAADCWIVSAGGATVDDLVGAVVDRYDVDESQARLDVAVFLDELLRENLLTADDGTATTPPALPPLAGKAAYVAPAVQKYDDLEDLLLLDPIHEVDEAGWPVARAD